jgi:FixH
MNWGNKLLMTFIVFGAGMFYLVYRSMNTNFELVEKDYYKSELRYQEVIDGSNRANALSTAVNLQQTDNGIILQMPEELKSKVISGDILFYCSYDSKKDRKFQLKISSDGTQLFPSESITPGNYVVKVSWISDKQNYYTEKKLTIL